MASALKFTPGSSIRWRGKRYVVVDYAGMDSIIARELGKRRLEHIAVRDAAPDRTRGDRTAWTPDLVSIPKAPRKRPYSDSRSSSHCSKWIELSEHWQKSRSLLLHRASIRRRSIGG